MVGNNADFTIAIDSSFVIFGSWKSTLGALRDPRSVFAR